MNQVRITMKPTKPLLPLPLRKNNNVNKNPSQVFPEKKNSRTNKRVKWADILCSAADTHIYHSIFTTSENIFNVNETIKKYITYYGIQYM
jgi:hypothetical protein